MSTTDTTFDSIRRVGGARYAAFLRAGYREHKTIAILDSTPWLLQKRVFEGKATLYFINISVFDWTKYDIPRKVGFEPKCQFKLCGNQGKHFDVTLHDCEQTPVEIENFFARIYREMDCMPYEED